MRICRENGTVRAENSLRESSLRERSFHSLDDLDELSASLKDSLDMAPLVPLGLDEQSIDLGSFADAVAAIADAEDVPSLDASNGAALNAPACLATPTLTLPRTRTRPERVSTGGWPFASRRRSG